VLGGIERHGMGAGEGGKPLRRGTKLGSTGGRGGSHAESKLQARLTGIRQAAMGSAYLQGAGGDAEVRVQSVGPINSRTWGVPSKKSNSLM